MDLTTLQARLGDDSPEARRNALEEISARVEDGQDVPGVVPALLGALHDPVGAVRNAASTALGWLAFKTPLRDAALIEPALALLTDSEAMVRHDGAWILESLAQRGLPEPRALPLLVANLDHPDADTRAASAFAIAALAKAGAGAEDTALAPLRRLTEAEGATERRAGEEALAALGAPVRS